MDIEKRLVKLERECRRWRRGVLVAACVVGCAFLVGAAKDGPPADLEVSSLVLKDERGRRRAELSMQKDDPWLTFFDQKGERLVMLKTLDGNGYMILSKNAGRTGASLTTAGKGPCVALWGMIDKDQARLGLSRRGPSLTMRSKSGRIFYTAP